MKRQIYSSTIKTIPYMYYNSKKIARLIQSGKHEKELMSFCVENNILPVGSLDRTKEVASKIYDRLSYLDDVLLDAFIHSDTITSKFILLYAIMKQDRLFFEFMFEVYREAILNNKKYLSTDDFEHYFRVKGESNEKVASWGHYTLTQISKAYRNVLKESGFGESNKKNILVVSQIVHPDILAHIKDFGDQYFLNSILGGESK